MMNDENPEKKHILFEVELLPIGTLVSKRSGRPFKSHLYNATIKAYSTNPYTGRQSYLFEEDDSNVECFRCMPAEDFLATK